MQPKSPTPDPRDTETAIRIADSQHMPGSMKALRCMKQILAAISSARREGEAEALASYLQRPASEYRDELKEERDSLLKRLSDAERNFERLLKCAKEAVSYRGFMASDDDECERLRALVDELETLQKGSQ